MSSFFEDIFSKHQCGFRIFFSMQQCLLTLLGKWKNAVKNIFLADLFFTLDNTEFTNYADDITPYAVSGNTDDLISSLEKSSKELLKWFDDNLMESNPDKCHLLVSSCENIRMEVGDFEI